MSGNKFLYLKAGRRVDSPVPSPDPSSEIAAYAATRRLALATADRSCCCPARPMVMAVMPMSSAHAEPIELFLCGHHYRASRQALADAGALIFDGKGLPVPAEAWTVPVDVPVPQP